jgi:hypothetical protein
MNEKEIILARLADLMSEALRLGVRLATLFGMHERSGLTSRPILDPTAWPRAATVGGITSGATIRTGHAPRLRRQDMILALLRASPGGLATAQIVDRVTPYIQTRSSNRRKAVIDALGLLTREGRIRRDNGMYFPI